MSLPPNALTGYEYGIGSNENCRRGEPSLPEFRLQGQAWHLNISTVGDVLQLPAKQAWQQLLSPTLFQRLGWTYDLLVIPEHIYKSLFTIRSHADSSAQVRESIIRLAAFIFCPPAQVWGCVNTIRADPNSLLFLESLKETWLTVPPAYQNQLRPKTLGTARGNHSSSFSPSQPSAVSGASPSTTTDHEYGGQSSLSQDSGKRRKSLTEKTGGARLKRPRRRGQKLIKAYFCLVTDCTRKPEGYKNRQACINHIKTQHAHFYLADPEWEAKVCSQERLIEVETESDPDRSSQSSKSSKKTRKTLFHQANDVETNHLATSLTAANTAQIGAGFQTHSPSGSSDGSLFFGQNNANAMNQGNFLEQVDIPFEGTIPQHSYGLRMLNTNKNLNPWSLPGDNQSDLSESINVFPPSRSSTLHRPPSQDPNHLSTVSPLSKRSHLR